MVLTEEQRKANKKASCARWRIENRQKTRDDARTFHHANKERRNRRKRELYQQKKAERLAREQAEQATEQPEEILV